MQVMLGSASLLDTSGIFRSLSLRWPPDWEKTALHRQVCMLAFSPIDYQTPLNGEVWIFGTPLFYQYTVHYNRQDRSRSESAGWSFLRFIFGLCFGEVGLGWLVRGEALKVVGRLLEKLWNSHAKKIVLQTWHEACYRSSHQIYSLK